MSEVGSQFSEGHVAADGFRIRYAEAGPVDREGPPLVHLHGAGGMRIGPTHHLLAKQFRVIAFEMPGFGASPENTRSTTMAELAATMARAAEALALDRFNLWGTSFGGRAALFLAVARPELVQALVLQAPAAIRPEGARPAAGSTAERARLLYGHPERMPPLPEVAPEIAAKMLALVRRLVGPARDADLEARMKTLDVPTLVLFGTLDRMIPSEMGRHYKELLPNCQLSLVYDAGHALDAERPEAMAEVVADFLERHEAFVISRSETVIHP